MINLLCDHLKFQKVDTDFTLNRSNPMRTMNKTYSGMLAVDSRCIVAKISARKRN